MSDTTFATLLNCMDGRVQIPVNRFLQDRWGMPHIDTITEAGIVRFLSSESGSPVSSAALDKIRISLEKHGSQKIALAAHAGCAGNPVADEIQKNEILQGVDFLKQQFPECEILGLWVNDQWTVEVVE